VLATYAKLGAKLVPVEPDPALGQIAGAIGFILQVESSASFDAATRSGDINSLQTGTSRSTWPNTFRQSRYVPAVEYIQAMRARTMLQHKMDAFMQYDAILTPGDSLSTVCNRTGHPAIAVKCCIVGGRPRPLILTGRLYDEGTLARIALAYEQATEWKDRHPTLANLG
jgi:Asp-tRNA(Asn)/Glu-tRNA(Gln) amidotransferase A subunit family amidase